MLKLTPNSNCISMFKWYVPTVCTCEAIFFCGSFFGNSEVNADASETVTWWKKIPLQTNHMLQQENLRTFQFCWCHVGVAFRANILIALVVDMLGQMRMQWWLGLWPAENSTPLFQQKLPHKEQIYSCGGFVAFVWKKRLDLFHFGQERWNWQREAVWFFSAVKTLEESSLHANGWCQLWCKRLDCSFIPWPHSHFGN